MISMLEGSRKGSGFTIRYIADFSVDVFDNPATDGGGGKWLLHFIQGDVYASSSNLDNCDASKFVFNDLCSFIYAYVYAF